MSRKPAEPSKKEQNEYIPSFISKKPFYLESAEGENDYLEHQRLHGTPTDQSKWYERGKRAGPAATKYRKGACENCGAMSHKTKDCLSRPRAKGAKWTGRDIQADEVVQNVQLGWDAKRDRWNGYDAQEYRNVVEEFEDLEAMKKKMKTGAENSDSVDIVMSGNGVPEQTQEEAKYAEESDMGREQSTATRNLRMREDTAKYLLNLDLESAKYDPKTRSMVDMGAEADQVAALVAEDNFMRASGDAGEFERAQKLAWESQERGDKNKVHLQANPTSGEYFRRKEDKEKQEAQEQRRKELLAKYGGEQYLDSESKQHRNVEESNKFVEYDASGAIKGSVKPEMKSKYPEDVFSHNHSSVWGSWWSRFTWGYACCHSTVRNSFCVGEQGKHLVEEEAKAAGDGRCKDTVQDDGDRLAISSDASLNTKKRPLLKIDDGCESLGYEDVRKHRKSVHSTS